MLLFHHQHLLAALVREFTKGYEHNTANGEGLYHFSGLKGQTRVSRHGLNYFSNRVTLVLSSPDKKFVDFFIRNLFGQHLIEVGGLILSPEMVETEQMPNFQEETKYICISPLVLTLRGEEEMAKEFILPDSDAFSDLLYDSTMGRMERSGFFSPEEIANFYKFQIVPDRDYIAKIYQEAKKFARIYTINQPDHSKLEVRGYTLPFALYAHPKVQQFVFECGLGEATTYGYGMIDLAHSDPTARAMAYDLTSLHITTPTTVAYR